MLHNIRHLILSVILLLVTFSWCLASLAYYNLFVIRSDDNPGIIYQLKILPNGEIIDPLIQYTLIGKNAEHFGITTDFKYLFTDTNNCINRFQIQADGNLFAIGTTKIAAYDFSITPNNKLIFITCVSGSTIFSITSTGDLVNGTSWNNPASNSKVDPLSRGLLGTTTASFSVYTINYNLQTLNKTTSFNHRNYPVYGFDYTPDGKLGFFYGGGGVTPSGGDLLVMKIDSTFNVTTTQVFDIPGFGINNLVASNDNRYVWASAFYGGIALYSIDPLGNLTDTGNRYYKGGTAFIKKTPDDRMIIACYEDNSSPYWYETFATAWINDDGSLAWTGYTFAMDSVYPNPGVIQDAVIVPVYITGISEELWQKLE
jgi:hypothetical protein